jgi:hypothetical protein
MYNFNFDFTLYTTTQWYINFQRICKFITTLIIYDKTLRQFTIKNSNSKENFCKKLKNSIFATTPIL